MLRLRTFGGLSLEGVDGQLTGRAVQPRRLALLTLLAATNHGRGISRDTLQALLWPDSDAEHARLSIARWAMVSIDASLESPQRFGR